MPKNDVLWQRLEDARPGELHKLCEILKISNPQVRAKVDLVQEISAALRAAAGHSIRNLFRDAHDFPYKQIVIDVADKLAPGWTFWSWTDYTLRDHHSEIEIEDKILDFLDAKLKEKIDQLSKEQVDELKRAVAQELQKLGYSEAFVTQVTAALAGGTAATILGPTIAYAIAWTTASGLGLIKLWWVGHASIALTLGMGGVLFAIIYGPALIWWLGHTAYRKTIPSVIELIKIRKFREIEAELGDDLSLLSDP